MASSKADQVSEPENVALSPEDAKKAEGLKEDGNKAFKEHHFEKAIQLYSKAIAIDKENASYLCNRAFCHQKLEKYGSAVEDATAAITANKRFVKAYYRRGCAYLAMGKLNLAQKDFEQAIKIKPNDNDCQRQLKDVKKVIMEKKFLKAIEVKHDIPSQCTDWQSVVVEASYDGPVPEEKYTIEFATKLLEHFKAQKKLHKKYVYKVLLDIIKLLSSLPTIVDVEIPAGTELTVCGDTHGQYYDLLNIFAINGMPSEKNPYIFNGDFVDRGSFSVEVILALFVLKLVYPNHMHLTRGNHESRNLNQIYGFQGEVLHKIDDHSFELFTEAFNYLPLGILIGNQILTLHGGLFSEDGVKLSDLRKINRNMQPPDSGLMCEMLWSDPQDEPGRSPSKRGVGLSFGPDVSTKFLQENKLKMLVRSHEVKEEGYEITHNGRVVTVFSAPNYCDSMDNKGAYIRFNSNYEPTYKQFKAVEHPPIKPMAYASPMYRM